MLEECLVYPYGLIQVLVKKPAKEAKVSQMRIKNYHYQAQS